MSYFEKRTFLSDLADRTELINAATGKFLQLPETALRHKPSDSGWNISEIYHHLNLVNGPCISEILKKITTPQEKESDILNTSWVADWIYEKVKPKENGELFRMETLKCLRLFPEDGHPQKPIKDFLELQDTLHDILNHSSARDLQKLKIPFFFVKTFHFRLCDTLRLLVAHNERHMMQARKVYSEIPAFQNG
jgi:hypothetical protein